MPKDYTIQQGDTLGALADKAGTTARQIAQRNNIQDPNRIQAGQTIQLPGRSSSSEKAQEGGGLGAMISEGIGDALALLGGESGGTSSEWVTREGDPYEYRKAPDGSYEARQNGKVVGRFEDAPAWLKTKTDDRPKRQGDPSVPQQAVNAAVTAVGGRERLMRGVAEKGFSGVAEDIKETWFDSLDESHEQYSPDDPRGDAYRHYEGSRRTAQKYGPATSLAVGVQHEAKNVMDYARGEYGDDYSLGQLLSSTGTDMANNIAGVFDGTVGRTRDSMESLSIPTSEYENR